VTCLWLQGKRQSWSWWRLSWPWLSLWLVQLWCSKKNKAEGHKNTRACSSLHNYLLGALFPVLWACQLRRANLGAKVEIRRPVCIRLFDYQFYALCTLFYLCKLNNPGDWLSVLKMREAIWLWALLFAEYLDCWKLLATTGNVLSP
jgi:hypothetical protein